MNSKYFLALAVTMAVQGSSAALTITIDGEEFSGDVVTVRSADSSSPNDSPPPNNDPLPNDNPPPPSNGGDCSGNLALTELPLRPGQNRRTMRNREVTAFRFTEADLNSRSIQFAESTDGMRGRKFLTISECAGDFNLANISSNCSRTGTSGTLWLQFGDPISRFDMRRSGFACKLEEDGRPYYLNVWYHDPDEGVDTCPGVCGFLVTN